MIPLAIAQVHQTIPSKTGKLEGIPSTNTSTLNNDFCVKMRQTESVCKKCYAATLEKQYTSLHKAVTRNDTFLGTRILADHEIPRMTTVYHRFSSVGELINVEYHLHNLVLITLANPQTTFALWTKRKDFIKKYFKNVAIPANLILVYSSAIIGKIEKLPALFHKVFTAHAKKAIENINVNCHGKCKDCLLCYTFNDTQFINEVLK